MVAGHPAKSANSSSIACDATTAGGSIADEELRWSHNWFSNNSCAGLPRRTASKAMLTITDLAQVKLGGSLLLAHRPHYGALDDGPRDVRRG